MVERKRDSRKNDELILSQIENMGIKMDSEIKTLGDQGKMLQNFITGNGHPEEGIMFRLKEIEKDIVKEVERKRVREKERRADRSTFIFLCVGMGIQILLASWPHIIRILADYALVLQSTTNGSV